jgi:hypothetical protein
VSKPAPPKEWDPYETPARWSKLGEQRVATMARLAEEGNTDAGRQLVDLAARCIRDGQPLPEGLRSWIAARLAAVVNEPTRAGEMLRVERGQRPGREPAHPNDMNKRLELEAMQDRAAWAVFQELHSEAPTKRERKAVLKDVSEWLRTEGWLNPRNGKPYAPSTVGKWYGERLAKMEAESLRLAEILKTLKD